MPILYITISAVKREIERIILVASMYMNFLDFSLLNNWNIADPSDPTMDTIMAIIINLMFVSL